MVDRRSQLEQGDQVLIAAISPSPYSSTGQ